ncbi:hypothetical protein HPB50_002080 [Hyalomma asiaticum]|uniref:Uncharacterized protein n=1 Tax=Hyalomma asiaticum TaxID=266040 RepID=A0ACB7T5J3_HYAAI|nr:hypothetical protein HPB50_002080 [Hyalomma asiaticum]
MTSVGEPFVLATVTNEADALRGSFCVQPGPSDSSSVVVTHGQLSASLVELEGRPFKIRTWNTSHAEPFTCPVVYDALRAKYVAASRKSLLILPPQDAAGGAATTRERIAVPDPVFAVLHRTGGEPLIVLESGVCTTLTELQGSPGKRFRSKKLRVCGDDEELVSVQAAMEAGRNGLPTLLLSVAGEAAGPYRCRVFRVGDAKIEQMSETSVPKSDRPPVCLFAGDLLSLGEDGSLSGRKLPLPSSYSNEAGAFLAALDDSRVLLGLRDRVLVWNVKFGTIETSRTLEGQHAKQWALVRNDVACFVVPGGSVTGSNNVMCLSVKLGRPTLSQVVGLGARVEGDVLPMASAVAAKICDW